MDSFLNQDQVLANYLTGLINKVAKNHEVEDLNALVLHDLCHDYCFGIDRAIYLVDNPDFDHLVGVAGCCCKECHHHKNDLWHEPHTFKHDMKDAQFHNIVRNIIQSSIKRKDINIHDSSEVKDLARGFGINDSEHLVWDSKHGNHGLLIFENKKEKPIEGWKKNILANIVSLLSFCGI